VVAPDILHGRFRHVDPQFPQFPDDPWRAPRGIRLPHRLDELANLLGHGGASGGSLLTQAPPIVTKALLLPGDHRAGLDKGQGIAPARPEPSQPRPEHPIGRTEARAINSLLVDRQLMPQCQVFQAQRGPRPKEARDRKRPATKASRAEMTGSMIRNLLTMAYQKMEESADPA
jgi:hypothetical protein